MQAALGVAQLERLNERLEKKRWIGRLYNELLADMPFLQLPLSETYYSENIYWVYAIVLSDCVEFDAGDAIKRLASLGIGTRPFFYPLHQQPVLRDLGLFEGESYPVAERIYRRGFYVPSGLALSEDQILRVVDMLKHLFEGI